MFTLDDLQVNGMQDLALPTTSQLIGDLIHLEVSFSATSQTTSTRSRMYFYFCYLQSLFSSRFFYHNDSSIAGIAESGNGEPNLVIDCNQ